MLDKIKTTGIGSLPEMSIDDAFKYSFKFDIPFFPQINSIHGDMTDQVQNCNFKYLKEFISIAETHKINIIKIQFAGPTTTKLSIPAYITVLDEIKGLNFTGDIILCIDEPVLNKNSIELIKSYKFFNDVRYKAIHSCSSNLEDKVSTDEFKYFDYVFYDSISNPNFHKNIDQKILAPGCIDFENSFITLPFDNPILISSTCGLEHCKNIEENFKKLENISRGDFPLDLNS